MDIKIIEVINMNDLKKFIHFPNILYRENSYRVPPLFINEYNTLRQDKNPAFEHCEARYWLAYKNGRIVGRIAGIINNPHIKKWKQRYLRFGWFDFYNDVVISEALLNIVESWAKEQGMIAVHGPLGFTDLDPVGMLVEGFEEMGTMFTIYNYSYYPKHMERMGYKKDVDWVEYEMVVPAKPNETIARIADFAMTRCKLKKLDVRRKKQLRHYAKDAFQLLDDTHQHLYGVVSLTEKQVEAYVKQYFGFLSSDYVPVILDQSDRLVAFGITMPSLSRALQKARGRLFPFGLIYILKALRKNNRADLCMVAVKPELQGKGVNAILIHNNCCAYNKLGIEKVESNPELEENRLVQSQWKYFERRQHKRRRCYIKHI